MRVRATHRWRSLSRSRYRLSTTELRTARPPEQAGWVVTEPKHNSRDPETTALYGLRSV
jgi:hypothetical protein